ncbi:MAG TPA: NADH-quinone oxidoreductase subunit J, partial [Caulobacteraceae bacterium]|nr:NADH-quinone oxidoreductase subunit J [Caulobacteraceae bacterium]
SESFGTVSAIGDLLFRDFLYPFEAISILLLVAIVGGVVISRSHQKEVAANRAADYRKQIHELSSHDYPGAPEAPAPEGHH